MNIIDLTRQSMNWNNPFQTRLINQIRRIGIHHTATATGNQKTFENHWRNLGWRNGGYHEIILPNGDVEICYTPDIVVNGVGDHNSDSYHIAVVGNFRPGGHQPSQKQMKSLIERIRFNMNRFTIPANRVLGHNEFPNTTRFNHRSNTCPGQNMNALRDVLMRPTIQPSPQPVSPIHTVRPNETLSSIARYYRTTVTELQRLNHIQNVNLIRVGQVLRLPTQNITIEAGSRVRVNDSARHWATGEAIPNWVRGRTYGVIETRRSGQELLLGSVVSWINLNDVTSV